MPQKPWDFRPQDLLVLSGSRAQREFREPGSFALGYFFGFSTRLGVEKSGVEKSGVEKFMVEKSGVEKFILALGL